MGERKTSVRDFTDLLVWKEANIIRIAVYELAKRLPEEEKFNLISQIKRSAVSVASNIAEGYGRFSYQENIQFCRQARGSLDETRDHLIFIKDVYRDLIKECEEILNKCLNCRKILNGYIKYLKEAKNNES